MRRKGWDFWTPSERCVLRVLDSKTKSTLQYGTCRTAQEDRHEGMSIFYRVKLESDDYEFYNVWRWCMIGTFDGGSGSWATLLFASGAAFQLPRLERRDLTLNRRTVLPTSILYDPCPHGFRPN